MPRPLPARPAARARSTALRFSRRRRLRVALLTRRRTRGHGKVGKGSSRRPSSEMSNIARLSQNRVNKQFGEARTFFDPSNSRLAAWKLTLKTAKKLGRRPLSQAKNGAPDLKTGSL